MLLFDETVDKRRSVDDKRHIFPSIREILKIRTPLETLQILRLIRGCRNWSMTSSAKSNSNCGGCHCLLRTMGKIFAPQGARSTMPIPLQHHAGVLLERRKFTTGSAQRPKCVSKDRFVGHAGGKHADGSTHSLEPGFRANAIVEAIKKGPVRAHFFSQRAITRPMSVLARRA